MSLADDAVELLRSKGYPAIEAGADRGLASALGRARDYLRSDDALDWGGAPVRAAALDALDRIEVAVPHLAHLGADEAKGLLEATFRGLGLDDTTHNDFFAISFEERRRVKWQIADDLAAETERRNEAWRAWKAALRDVGTLALRALVPLLLAAL